MPSPNAASSASDDPQTPIGRRERKRMETRQALVRAAIELFARRGFDEVTVADIAEHADVDASTFFRHFGSKEAVLFTDMSDFTGVVRSAILARPADESTEEAVIGAISDLSHERRFDPKLEFLRGKLALSSPALQAQGLVYRERMILELSTALAERAGVDPDADATPYLSATLWVAALEWYRRQAVAHPVPAKNSKSMEQMLSEIVDLVRPIWPNVPPLT